MCIHIYIYIVLIHIGYLYIQDEFLQSTSATETRIGVLWDPSDTDAACILHMYIYIYIYTILYHDIKYYKVVFVFL